MRTKFKSLMLVILFALIIVTAFNITMNFSIAGILVIILLMGLCYIFKQKDLTKSDYRSYNIDNTQKIIVSILSITCVSLLTTKSLSNYFYPESLIYTNSDHHAVKLVGARINNPRNFLLASDNENALFDNEKFNGHLYIKRVDNENRTVTLQASGFTQSVYLENYDADNKLNSAYILNVATEEPSLIAVKPNESIQFINKNDTCELSFDNEIKDYILPFKEDVTKGIYICKSVSIDTLSESRILKRGLELNQILAEISNPNISFQGINLLRPSYKTELKREQIKSLRDSSFVLELDKRVVEHSKLTEIRVVPKNGDNPRSYIISDLLSRTSEINIPFGKPFSIGNLSDLKTPSIRFDYDSLGLYYEYVTPKYKGLYAINKNGSNTIFMTSSLSQELIESYNTSQNIISFDLFYNEGNKCNFSEPIYLSFVSGPTIQKIDFLLNHQDDISVGESFPNIRSINGKILWNIQIENFKESNIHIIEQNIIIFIAALTLLLVIVMVFGTKVLHPTLVEILAYIAIIVFFSIRLLLLWRASAFPPSDLATIYEFNHFFRNSSSMLFQFIALNTLITIILAVKSAELAAISGARRLVVGAIISNFIVYLFTFTEIYLFNLSSISANWILWFVPLVVFPAIILMYRLINSSKLNHLTVNIVSRLKDCVNRSKCPQLLSILLGILFVVLLTVVAFMGKMQGSPLLKLMWPILFYILVEVLIWYFCSSNKTYQVDEKYESLTITDIFNSGLGWSLLSGLTISAVLLILDGGYGIIFFTFFILTSILKINDFIRTNRQFVDYKQKIRVLSLNYSLAILFILCLPFYKSLMIFVTQTSILGCVLLFFLLISVILILINYILGIRLVGKKRKIILLIATSLILSCSVTLILREKVLTNHTLQRVLVHVYSPAEGLAKTTTLQDERRFFEASLNDYILNVYNQEASDIGLLGLNGKGYFKLLPHSKVGALWGAQASDILPARFIIAEHGKLLPVLLVVIYILMFYAGIVTHTKYRVSKMLLIQIPALLLIHSLFVWLANNQMFIFLGQDFPLMSLHSKFTIMYFFSLVVIWVSVAIVERMIVSYGIQEQEFYNVNDYPYNEYVGSLYCLVLLMLLLLFYVFNSPKRGKTYRSDDKRYELKSLLENETSPKFSSLNEMFAKYQEDTSENSIKPFVKRVSLSDVSDIITDFDNKYSEEIIDCLGGKESFHYRLWERFAHKGGSKNNSSSSIIHVRYKRDKLEIIVKKNFYDKKLPDVGQNELLGSVVTSNEHNSYIPNYFENNDYKQYVLPDTWTIGNSKVVIIKSKKRSGIVANDHRQLYNIDKGYSATFRRMLGDDFANKDMLPVLAEENYLARGVIINGKKDFLYPMSEKFFWAYTFAHELNNRTEELNNGNVQVTFDKELTLKIYDKLGKALSEKKPRFFDRDSSYMSVVVADGNGNIRAMVDRKPSYILNPNNKRLIAEISEDLYMNYVPEQSDFYFGNLNLMAMKDGPGSSQKPIVWTAVASKIDYKWKDMEMFKFIDNAGLDIVGNSYYTKYFAGERLYPKSKDSNPQKYSFKAITSDENYGNGVDLSTFMHHSSNYYNAVMLYIGAFSEADIDMSITTNTQNDNNALFVKVNENDIFINKNGRKYKKPLYDSIFPILTKDQRLDKMYAFNKRIPTDGLENSILYSQLGSMFGFNSSEKMSSIYPGIKYKEGKGSTYSYLVNPTYRYNIVTEGYRKEFLLNAIQYAAVGGGSPWQVSPLSMAQMFGQLVMLKSNYLLTIDPKSSCDEFLPYEDLSKGYLDARPELLKGMNQVFSRSIRGTTARSIGATEINGKMTIGGYYIYGKTGTATENNSKNTDLHRLGVVITSKPIENLDVDELKDVKFYTVYFTARDDGYISNYGEILKLIIESDSFKSYMSN